MIEVAELLALFGGGIIANILAQRWRIPSAIPLLLFGVIIGPEFLGIVDSSDIGVFAELGKVLMLFMIGWTFDITKIRHRAVSTILILIIKFFSVFIVSYELLLFFNTPEAAIISMAMSFSSTAFFASFVKEYKLLGKEEANMLIALLVFEDIIAVFLLSYLSTTHSGTLTNVIGGLFYSIILIVISYLVVKMVIDYILAKIKDSENMLVMFALALAGIFAYLTSLAGFDPATGAFLAGSISGASHRMKRTEEQLNLITEIFFMIFILSIGISVSISFIMENIPLIILLTLMNTLTKTFSIATGLRLVGRRDIIEWGVLMGTTGEFSLIVATAVKGFDAISLVASMIFISSVIVGMAFSRKEHLEELKKVYPISAYINAVRKSSQSFNRVVSMFEFSGEFWKSADIHIKNAIVSVLLLIILSTLLIGGGIIAVLLQIYDNISVMAVITGILVLPIIYRILVEVSKILDFISSALKLNDEEWRVRVVRNVVFLFLLMSISIILMFVIPVMNLPSIMNRAYIVPLFLGVLIVWNTMRALEEGLLEEKKRNYFEKKKNARLRKILEDIPLIGSGRRGRYGGKS